MLWICECNIYARIRLTVFLSYPNFHKFHKISSWKLLSNLYYALNQTQISMEVMFNDSYRLFFFNFLFSVLSILLVTYKITIKYLKINSTRHLRLLNRLKLKEISPRKTIVHTPVTEARSLIVFIYIYTRILLIHVRQQLLNPICFKISIHKRC